MLEEVTTALTNIEANGSFATEVACSADDLRIEVEGLGLLRFPLSAATAQRLCALARPAPFGRRDKTLFDARVRDTWEIGRKGFRIDARAWKQLLAPQLAVIRERLGLPESGKLEVVLDKMLVYGKGQFFSPHQDSERADDMVGSLVVQLPSRHKGGALVVKHHGKTKVLGRAARGPKDLALLAFYADCQHEVKPVESGYRVTLACHLLHHAVPGESAVVEAVSVDRLAESVRSYFSTPLVERYSSAPARSPDRLVYLLDHEYSEKSLGWSRLKSADRVRAAALQEVASRLDCEVFLALADVHESWQCESDEWGGGYGRRRWRSYRRDEDDDDGEDANAAKDHVLVELIDSDLELRHWVATDGRVMRSVSSRPTAGEICWTKASDEMNPFKSEHEGYMGNYGDTVDRWYHRAAVVMWPRARSFAIRAKVSPSWAVKQLAARVRRGDVDDARAKAGELLPFWKHTVQGETSEAFVRELFGVATSLDAETAFGLVSPLGPHRLNAGTTPAFVDLVERHGSAWSQRVFSAWSDGERYHPQPWLPFLPRLCKALVAGGEVGVQIAPWLLRREVGAFEIAHEEALSRPPARREDDAGRRVGELAALMDAAAVIQAPAIRDDLVAFLVAPATVLPLMSAGALFKKLAAGRTPARVKALGLDALYRHVVSSLEGVLAAGERSSDDWAIEPPSGCKCDLCPVLAEFLRDRHRTQLSWPLAEDRRRHVHGMIDSHRLPVTHETTRKGRPYSLVLTKQEALFERERVLRGRQRVLLTWLTEHRSSFE